MTTAIQASSAEQVDDGGGVAWRIFTNSSFAINVDKQTNKVNNPHTPHFKHLNISIQFLSLFYDWLVKMCC